MASRIIIREIERYEQGWSWQLIWPATDDRVSYRTGEDGRDLYCLRDDGSWWLSQGTGIDLSGVRDHAEARHAIRIHWDRVLGAADV